MKVFTTSHRNPQGLFVAPDGRIWETEHGPQGSDEVNLLTDAAERAALIEFLKSHAA